MELAAKFNLPVVISDRYARRLSGLDSGRAGARMGDRAEFVRDGPSADSDHRRLDWRGLLGRRLGIGVGDTIGMLEHSYYSVISPEGCASILWKDAGKNAIAAAALKMHAEDLIELGMIDAIIPEPQGGAHHDPKQVLCIRQILHLRAMGALCDIPRQTASRKSLPKIPQNGQI